MTEYTTSARRCRFSGAASLIALGVRLKQLDLFRPVHDTVKIAQKTIRYSPTDKLYDALITMLAGGRGLVEINTRLRSDPALQQAFGRTGCAEQSVVQQTLDACTATSVDQLQQALTLIYQRHSAGYKHDYGRQWQLLDIDLTGLPCGPKAALATKGYFGEQRYRRGRQMGRVLASRYQEVVVDQLYAGNCYLAATFQNLVLAAEQTLSLDEAKRARTILRIDAGGGGTDHINWALARGYQVHTKDYSGQRSHRLAQTVRTWVDDPVVPGRQLGWVEEPAPMYIRPVRRLAARCRKRNGQWGVGIIVSTVDPAVVQAEVKLPADLAGQPDAALLADAYFYDDRGGGVETSLKDDKQGLGIGKRNKKRFEAQQVVMLLAGLAHNILIWARGWLAATTKKAAQYGVLRLVRDVLHISGRLVYDQEGHLRRIILNRASPVACELVAAFQQLLATAQVRVNLGET